MLGWVPSLWRPNKSTLEPKTYEALNIYIWCVAEFVEVEEVVVRGIRVERKERKKHNRESLSEQFQYFRRRDFVSRSIVLKFGEITYDTLI